MQYDNLPKELRDNGKFCVWKFEARKGKTKPGKVPYQISGKRAQSNNEHTFSNYSDAVAAVSHYDGLGLGIFRGFSAVDVDHCVNTDGTLTAIGQSIAEIFTGCYIEINQDDLIADIKKHISSLSFGDEWDDTFYRNLIEKIIVYENKDIENYLKMLPDILNGFVVNMNELKIKSESKKV